ncbi:hypothetical protein [Haloferula sp.]|uniref:hypothetical protein n=1 Tax=Haloferula sp. TaxID=2497595 RepID=UPI00329FBB65
MPKFRTISRWIFGTMICLLTGIAHAERPLRILYFQAPAGAPEKACIYSADSMVMETELPRHNFSENIIIPKGDVTLRFLPKQLDDGAEMPIGAPGVKIPSGWQKVLLLVAESKENSVLPIRLKAINASDSVFGPGSIYMMNLSKIRVGGTVGDKKLDLRPSSVEIIKNPISGNGFYPTKLFSVATQGARPQRFIKQMWKKDDATRQVLFILPKPAPQYATYYCAPIEGL